MLSQLPPSMLSQLPPELLVEVACHLGSCDLLSLAAVGRGCREAADDERPWRALLARQFGPILQAFFDGETPPPEGLTWKRHFFDLGSDWKRRAQRRTGRLLVQVGTQKPERGLWELIEGDELWRTPSPPTTYGIYDVTHFVDEHPGAELIILDAAEAADATHSYEINGHSAPALRRLATLAVPGLEELPYDSALIERRQRARMRRLRERFYPSVSPAALRPLGEAVPPVCLACVCGLLYSHADAGAVLSVVAPLVPLLAIWTLRAALLCAGWCWRAAVRGSRPQVDSPSTVGEDQSQF